MNNPNNESSENPTDRQSLRIADLSNDDKPREKALRNGIGSLSNAELLAIIFGGGLPGMSVVQMSQNILSSVDNKLSTLARLTIGQMTRRYKGIGPAKAISLLAAFELGARCRDEQPVQQPQVTDSRVAFSYIRGYIERLDYEEFWVMTLSRANRIIAATCVSQGGAAMTVVDIKKIMRTAIDGMASGIIVAHNHPSGNLSPSGQDDALTRKIKDAAELLDVKLLDHLIVAVGNYYSYADKGRL